MLAFLPLNFAARNFAVRSDSERFDADIFEKFVMRQIRIAHQIAHAETPRVVEKNLCAALNRENNMVVFAGRNMFMRDDHASRHAEMQQKCLILIQRHQDIFTPARDIQNAPPLEPRCQTRRQGQAQIRAMLLKTRDALALQSGGEAAADGFNFG